jgi:hypothetical protein
MRTNSINVMVFKYDASTSSFPCFKQGAISQSKSDFNYSQ